MTQSSVFIFSLAIRGLPYAYALLVMVGCNKKNEPIVKNDKAVGTVKDACGNVYNYVKIGKQYWMAENMRCNKYDSESEAKGVTVSGVTLSNASETTFPPHYIDVTDKSNWFDEECPGDKNFSQVKQLGFYYNYAAAMGFENEASEKSATNIKRQGICPNGWHLPTHVEWNVLIESAGGENVAGKRLSSNFGWCNNYDYNGTDNYGFAALPAGSWGVWDNECAVGVGTAFLSISTPNNAGAFAIFVDGSFLTSFRKDSFLSVRCVKD